MLEAKDLVVTYGTHTAVRGLNLSIAGGEIYALLGSNGAGKTSTINCFLGFVTPHSGHVNIAGLNPQKDPVAVRRALAYIPEQVKLYTWFTGFENLVYFTKLAGQSHDDNTLKDFLRQAGLQEDAFDRKVAGYSKGMRQKVGIAIALAKNAKALLLDEPTSGLDPAASHEFSECLRQLSRQGVAVLMATHDLFRALDVADRIGIMQGGVLRREYANQGLTAVELEKSYLEVVSETLEHAG